MALADRSGAPKKKFENQFISRVRPMTHTFLIGRKD